MGRRRVLAVSLVALLPLGGCGIILGEQGAADVARRDLAPRQDVVVGASGDGPTPTSAPRRRRTQGADAPGATQGTTPSGAPASVAPELPGEPANEERSPEGSRPADGSPRRSPGVPPRSVPILTPECRTALDFVRAGEAVWERYESAGQAERVELLTGFRAAYVAFEPFAPGQMRALGLTVRLDDAIATMSAFGVDVLADPEMARFMAEVGTLTTPVIGRVNRHCTVFLDPADPDRDAPLAPKSYEAATPLQHAVIGWLRDHFG